MGAAARENRTGELLAGRYELHEVLEAGEVYDTYRATDRRDSLAVAIKLLRPELALRSAVVQGFVSGPKRLAGLRHPNLARVLAVESDDTGIPFVVEERVEGEPLSRSISRFSGGMPVGGAITMIAPVVEAMAAAHALGIAHGRLDSEHVVLEQQGGSSVPKVTGLAHAPQGGPEQARLAPELRDGRASADARSDVWALGALLYETLCGEAPAAAKGLHVALDEVAPHLPSELTQLVERCLAPEPARRFGQAGEVREALSRARANLRGGGARAKAEAFVPAEPTKPARPPAKSPQVPPARRPDARLAAKPSPVRAAAKPSQPRAASPARPVGRRTAAGRDVALPALESAALQATVPEPSAAEEALDASFEATFAAFDAPAEPAAPEPLQQDADAARLELALGATVAQAEAPLIPSVIPLPGAGEAAFASFEPSDEPEITLEPITPSQAPKLERLARALRTPQPRSAPAAALRSVPPAPAPAMEVKTLGDLAAAFEPIEGADRIVQSEHEDNARARAFRERAASKPETAARSRDPGAPSKAEPARSAERRSKSAAIPGSVKQLREASAVVRGPSPEQIREARERAQRSQRGRRRILGELLFFLFAFVLLFAIPLLWDPSGGKARALLGQRTQLAAGGLALLSVVTLVRTWAMQIQGREMMLRPVTISLRVVTVTVCALCATYFLPAGALGPAEAAARTILPWASGGFYLAFGLYGMLRGVREAASSPIFGIVLTLLYSGGFFGSYRALAATVLARGGGRGVSAAAAGGVSAQAGGGLFSRLHRLASGEASGDVGQVATADAGAPETLTEKHHAGGSEAEDMQGIEEMERARKRKGAQFDALGKQIHTMIRAGGQPSPGPAGGDAPSP